METVKPFVKWAGGKGSLISQLTNYYPFELKDGTINKYVEPFVGGGAVLIDILQKYNVKTAYAFDINRDLINCYNVIKTDVDELIEDLKEKEENYLDLEIEDRQKYFYEIREEYNSYEIDSKKLIVKRATEFIFLNRTCFNGLYRVNKNGKFNVPFGRYKNPSICDTKNLKNLSKLFENVIFQYGDYKESNKYIDNKTFVYFDPPYRPLSNTSSFTSYAKEDFDDDNQKELANYFEELNYKDAKLMLSNSNPKNTKKDDVFFETIYKDFFINEIYAKRMINSNAKARGKISELVITNYEENNKCIQKDSILKMSISN